MQRAQYESRRNQNEDALAGQAGHAPDDGFEMAVGILRFIVAFGSGALRGGLRHAQGRGLHPHVAAKRALQRFVGGHGESLDVILVDD